MTPAEIAKKLTPAQVRALRDISAKHRNATLWALYTRGLCTFWIAEKPRHLTGLGHAVLAELDKGETNGSR